MINPKILAARLFVALVLILGVRELVWPVLQSHPMVNKVVAMMRGAQGR